MSGSLNNSEKILLVEDNPRVRSVFEKMFQRFGYPYEIAADGVEALEKLKQGSFGLGIYDIIVPRMDGIELLAHTMETDPEIPVIILSSAFRVEMVIEILNRGAFAFIRKPFNMEEIHTEIKKGLRQRSLFLENRNYHRNLEKLVEDKTLSLKKSQGELLLEKEKLENVLQNLGAGLQVMNEKGKVIWRNEIIKGWFGEIEDWRMIVKTQIPEMDSTGCQSCEVFQGARSQSRRLTLDCIDGMRREFRWNCSPIIDSDGEVIQAVSLVQDITERTRLEQELLRSDKLSAMGEIAAGWAHEINNPIGIILGMVQNVLAETPAGTQLYSELKIVEEETLRTSRVVRTLLDFIHEPTLETEEVDLFEVCRSSVAFLDFMLKEKGLNTVFEIEDKLPDIEGNADQLKQVIINILINSIHATPYGGLIKIKMNLVNKQSRSGYLLCEISDNGTGIAPEDLRDVFKPFFTRKGKKGTGLGLSIARRIIENHGGKIDLKSELNKGASISIMLPL